MPSFTINSSFHIDDNNEYRLGALAVVRWNLAVLDDEVVAKTSPSSAFDKGRADLTAL